jgi:multidrug efflux system membrane fusion protein
MEQTHAKHLHSSPITATEVHTKMTNNTEVTATKPRKTWLIGLVTLIVLAVVLLLSRPLMSQGKRPQRNPVTPVQVAASQRADVPVYFNALGTVVANYTVTVTSRVDGILDKVYFTEGQKVEKGQLLAQIDPRAYQSTLKQYQGALEQNQALLKSARATLDRYQKLYADDSLSRQDLESQQATVGQYSGLVKTDQAQIDSARLSLQYARITAPISGYVGLRLTDPGNMVHSTDTTGIVSITQSQPIAVTFSLPEANVQDVLPLLRKGKALPVQAYDRQRTTVLASGTVKFISNQIDSTTGTIKLKAMFDNQDEHLYPNQFVNIRLQTTTLPQAIIVPSAAVQLGNQGSYVYQVNADNTVSKKLVTVGPAHGDWVVVSTGLTAGSRVVTAGIDHLHDGAKVEPLTQAGNNSRPAK